MAASLLPTEIITEILSRLPVKPLLRFKSVAKSWYFLIKSPNFIKLHLTNYPNHLRHVIISHTTLSSAAIDDLTFSEMDHPLKPIKKEDTLNYFPEPPGIDLLGHSNGVVSISNATKTNVFLYAPATRTRRRVPPSHVPYPDDFVVFGFGFGFGGEDGDDYKLLRIIQCRESHCHVKFYNEAKLYSLKEDSWKWVRDMPYFLVYKDCHGVFVNLGFHFIVVTDEFDSRFKYIARFDIRSEEFSLIELPVYEDEFGVSKLVLRELGGKLCVMVNYRSGLGADLWVMNEYGKKESWVRLMSLEIRPRFSEVRPVAFSNDDEKVLLLIDNCQLQWCDLKSEDEKVKVVRSSALLVESFDAGVYVDSVVSLDDWSNDSQGKHQNKDDLDDFLSVGFKLRL
ncbi:F-box protein CPR1-like isoform X2 [Silene latifolia]|uniref:F-box protein CPR1-like isoform X2 n=1 Tax=Silene latifolia TaxID=37657 RepID=UPI003D7796F7